MQQEEPNKKKPNQKDELEGKKTDNEFVRKFAEEKYKYGFTTEVHTDIIERGLNEDVIRLISSKKDEPEWMLDFRLKAYTRDCIFLQTRAAMRLFGLGKTQVRRFALTHGVRTKRIHGNRLYYLKADWDAARKLAEQNSASTKKGRL